MTEEKLKDGEHREYDENRVLKKIFHTKNGQLDGEYKEFDNKGGVIISAEYKDGALHGRRISNILEDGDASKEYELSSYRDKSVRKEEIYDRGILQHRKLTDNTSFIDRDSNDCCKYFEDMEFKKGKEYNGSATVSIVLDADDVNSKSYQYEKTIVNGKRDGKYVWKEMIGNEMTEIDTCYNNGIPYGSYSEKRTKDTGEYLKIKGEYKDGRFTGTRTSGDKAKFITEQFENGNKIDEKAYTIEQLYEGYVRGKADLNPYLKYEKTFYPDGALKRETGYHIEKNRIGQRLSYLSYTRDFDKTGKETVYTDYAGRIVVGNGKNMTQKLEDRTVKCEVKKVGNDYIKDGAYKETHKGGWVMLTGTYKDGQKHGVFTEYYSDGKVASVRHYSADVDVTKTYDRMKRVAAENVSSEKGVISHKRSDSSKVFAITKAKLRDMVNGGKTK